MDATDRDSPPSADADVESNLSDALLGTNELTAFTSQVRITFHHTRKRLADLDGLSGKAAIDGIVDFGLLSDDTPKQVAEISHRQSKGRVEETKIIIEEI